MKTLAGKKKIRFLGHRKSSELYDPDVVVKLYEVLQGERKVLRIFSKFLDSEICLVNSALTNLEKTAIDCPVYTTEELAFILSLTAEELKRYHYLKTRLVD